MRLDKQLLFDLLSVIEQRDEHCTYNWRIFDDMVRNNPKRYSIKDKNYTPLQFKFEGHLALAIHETYIYYSKADGVSLSLSMKGYDFLKSFVTTDKA